jgi:hypothetical protein
MKIEMSSAEFFLAQNLFESLFNQAPTFRAEETPNHYNMILLTGVKLIEHIPLRCEQVDSLLTWNDYKNEIRESFSYTYPTLIKDKYNHIWVSVGGTGFCNLYCTENKYWPP